MTDLPDVTIVMTTWITDELRLRIVKETLHSWVDSLFYRGKLRLHVADDGSTIEWNPEEIWPYEISYSSQERKGVGASLNAGFKKAFEVSPLVLYAVDDWRLLEPFDITPWCVVLLNKEDVGIVRLGPPHPFLRGEIETLTTEWQGWGLRLDRYGLVVGHRPEIFHKRMIDAYGWFDEGVNAQECERLYTVRYANQPGPDIVLALPHPWFHYHLDVVPSLSGITPGEEID